jgi:glucosamine--fructose-6-phosphate aminotransferase (isomerizing)
LIGREQLLTRYIDKELKLVLLKRGYAFHTETDTEAVAVLCKYVYDSQPHKRLSFTELIKTVIKELVSRSPTENKSGP